MVPVTKVIAEPLANARARTGERRAGDDERAEPRAAREHRVVRRGGHHRAVEVVCGYVVRLARAKQ